ncbi:MAG: hypothetical protein RIR26_907, partial [Pseudomonadota bacterium]
MKRLSKFQVIIPLFALTACGGAGIAASDSLTNSQEGEAFIKTGDASTFLKKTTADSSNLSAGSEKCVIPANTKIVLRSDPLSDGSHLLVDTEELLPGCEFSKGYVFRPHVAASSLRSLFSANVSAFLDTIGYAEGTGDEYNYMFTHKIFYSYSDHPRT